MLTYSQARTHAMACGMDLVNADAVPLDKVISRSASGRGAWLAYDVVHPEDLRVIYPAGYWIDKEDIPKLAAIGVDYVVCQE